MKTIFALVCLYPFLAFSKPLYYDTDIQPVFENFIDSFQKEKKAADEEKAFNGFFSIFTLYTTQGAAFSKEHPEDKDMIYLSYSIQTLACEIYAIKHYKLEKDYLMFLQSPELDKAIENVKKEISKHNQSIEDILGFIHKEFSAAMKAKFPKLAKIYDSAIFWEARLRIFSTSSDKNKKQEPKEAVKELMVMKEMLGRRIEEALEGFAPEDFPNTLSQAAVDLRSYYRISNCPEDFAHVFVDYLSVIDEFATWAKDTPKDVKPEEAFATVFIWTLAGGNPLEPALINEQENAKWQTKGRELQKKFADAENKLNKAVIKYGLRL